MHAAAHSYAAGTPWTASTAVEDHGNDDDPPGQPQGRTVMVMSAEVQADVYTTYITQ